MRSVHTKKDMSSIYDVFFANNLRRVWSMGPSGHGSPVAGGVKGHPRRESKMTRSLASMFSSGSGGRVKPKKNKCLVNNVIHKFKYIVCVFCLLICLYQLIKFLALYFSYKTSVDAEVLIDNDPKLPGITLCYNQPLHDWILSNRSHFFQDLANKSGDDRDDVSALVSEQEYQILMLRKCAFRYFNNTDVLLKGTDCESAWAFNGNEQCTVINAEWAKPLINTGGFSEFMYGVETYFNADENSTMTPGVDVFIHSPRDIPSRRIRSYFITLGSVYKANFKKTIVHRLEPPFITKCKNYLKRHNETKEFIYVSQQTCYYDCLWRYYNETCGCIPKPIPFIRDYKACNISMKTSCGAISKYDLWNLTCDTRCPIACRTDYYEYSITKLVTITNQEIFRTYVEVFHELRGNIVVIFTHKPQITNVEIFSNIGGYLGIWLGMSVPLLYDLLVYTLFVIFNNFSASNMRIKKPFYVH